MRFTSPAALLLIVAVAAAAPVPLPAQEKHSAATLKQKLIGEWVDGGLCIGDTTVLNLDHGKCFYIQWDGLGAGTRHYYGPFRGDPAQKLGLTLSETNAPKLKAASSDPPSPKKKYH